MDVKDARSDAPPLRAQLLGRTRIAIGEREIADDAWPRRTPRALLLLLLITPGNQLPRDRVLDLLWPDLPPKAALNAFYKALHALRRVLEPGIKTGKDSSYVAVSGATVRLVPLPGFSVDVEAFETALAAAQAAAPAERRPRLREAVTLYTGELLPDEPYVDWPVARREELRRRWEGASLDLAEAEVEAGEPRAAIAPLEALLATDPANEEAHRALMHALARSGQRERALRQYERCRQALAAELDATPSAATEALAAEIAASTDAAVTRSAHQVAVQPRLNTLPTPPTPLIGREREVEAVQELLWRPEVRLVTITGAGGIGKTRLALEAAAGVLDDFDQGVAFVSLASVGEPAAVPSAIAGALGVREEAGGSLVETLTEALRDRALLLVLDNFEHLLPAAPLVADLLAACPKLKVLVTSREYLYLRGEHEFEAPPLGLPDPDRLPSTEYLARNESVALFLQTVRGVRPTFVVDDDNARVIAEICVRLDGLPLAIELAAARVKHLPLAILHDQLASRLDLLADGPRDLPTRQRTLRDTIGWSYDLLDADEQRLFRRLSVFRGGCTFDATEAIGGSQQSAVASLAAKHLVRVEEAGDEPRITMLETIREYGREQLNASGEADTVQRMHLTYFMALAEQAEAALIGADQTAWTERLATEHDNLQEALETALALEDTDVALRFAGGLWRFWWMRGHLSEGRGWLARALNRPGESTAARALALNAAARLAESQGDYDEAECHFTASMRISHHLDDHLGVAEAHSGLGLLAQHRAEYDRAVAHHDQALALYRDHGSERDVVKALTNLAAIAYFRGDVDHAEKTWTECLPLLRQIGDQHSTALILGNLGTVALARRDVQRAIEIHTECLAISRRLDDPAGTVVALVNLAGAQHAGGDLDSAADHYLKAAEGAHDLGDRRAEAIAYSDLGWLWLTRGDVETARSFLVESLTLFRNVGDRAGAVGCLDGIASVIGALGDATRAARLHGAAASLRAAFDAMPDLGAAALLERRIDEVRSTLGETAFASAWEAGQTLSLDQAIDDALAILIT